MKNVEILHARRISGPSTVLALEEKIGGFPSEMSNENKTACLGYFSGIVHNYPVMDPGSRDQPKYTRCFFLAQMVKLGGGCKYVLCSPRKLEKMNPIWRAYFSDGLVQPPTSNSDAFFGALTGFSSPLDHQEDDVLTKFGGLAGSGNLPTKWPEYTGYSWTFVKLVFF